MVEPSGLDRVTVSVSAVPIGARVWLAATLPLLTAHSVAFAAGASVAVPWRAAATLAGLGGRPGCGEVDGGPRVRR
jgi:hypothetical protein